MKIKDNKILFIYLNNLIPIDSGSKRNSLSLVDYLNKGNSIDLLSIYYEKKNDLKIKKYFNKLYELKSPLNNIFYKMLNKFFNLFIMNDLRKDPIFKFFIKIKLKKILKNKNYDKIILNYVQFSTIIPKNFFVKTIIFTHDVYYSRFLSLNKKKVQRDYIYKMTKKYELEQLNKFSKILVVSRDEEKKLLQYINVNKLKYIGAPQTIKDINNRNYIYKFGFIGANSFQNIEAIIYFANNILPHVKGEIVIAGSVCNNNIIKDISKNKLNIKLMGYVNDVKNFYESCQFVVATINSGSGIKIKVLEALSYGKVVLITEKANEGIGVRHMKEVINIDKIQTRDLENLLVSLNNKNYDELSSNAKDFIRNNFSTEKLYKNILGN